MTDPVTAVGYYDHVRVTRVLHVDLGATQVWLKNETEQVTGAFKFRGNVNHLLRHPAPRVITASTGNHGIGLAAAARALGRRATVYVPTSTPAAKLDKLEATGADIVITGREYDECHTLAAEASRATGSHYVPSFEDSTVIDGHSRLFAESLRQAGIAFDRVYVPVGGGGLLAAATRVWPASPGRLVGVELDLAPALHASLKAGRLVELTRTVAGVAEGLVVRRVGDLPFRLILDAGVRVTLADLAGLSRAMRWIWRQIGVRVEAAGAASVAALLQDLDSDESSRATSRHVLCVLSGGNIDTDIWRGVVEAGRDLTVPKADASGC